MKNLSKLNSLKGIVILWIVFNVIGVLIQVFSGRYYYDMSAAVDKITVPYHYSHEQMVQSFIALSMAYFLLNVVVVLFLTWFALKKKDWACWGLILFSVWAIGFEVFTRYKMYHTFPHRLNLMNELGALIEIGIYVLMVRASYFLIHSQVKIQQSPGPNG